MPIASLLNPRSIAIVGASDKVGPGFNAWKALEHVGFSGRVVLVNPKRTELFGRKTYPSLREVDGEIDAAFVAVRAEEALEVVSQAAEKRCGGLAILSSGFGDAGEAGRALQRQLAARAAEHGIAVCGPNCLGLINFARGAALFGTSLPDAVKRGGVAAIVQSGSIGIALLNSARGVGLSHLVTSGNEAVTTAADYVEAFIEDPAVSTIVVFAEQIRNPAKFTAMARRAVDAGKPVIVLKSGRSEQGRAAVMAHTGAVAGSAEACDAALLASGATQVFSLDELLEAALLFSQLRARPSGRKLAALSLSGGEIALALDAAEKSGVQFADVQPAAAELKRLLPEFAHIANPLDLTWAGLYDQGVATCCAQAMAALEEVGAVVLLQDAPSRLGVQQAGRYTALLQAVARGVQASGKPLIAVSNLSDQPHPDLEQAALQSGVPYLRGTHEGLLAIGRYVHWGAPRRAQRAATPSSVLDAARSRWAALPRGRFAAEHEALGVLAAYGIDAPPQRLVRSAEEAAAAASALGFPVVLKGLAEGTIHKSEAGLVRLRLESAAAVREAAQAMAERSRGGAALIGFLVQKMLSPVAELLVGARVDPEFGPLIVVGGGGTTVELYRDVAVRVAPITSGEALEALAATRSSRLLDGWRGAPEGDKPAAAAVISALSRFIADFAAEVSEVEINPLAVLEAGRGCIALDCVIVPRPPR